MSLSILCNKALRPIPSSFMVAEAKKITDQQVLNPCLGKHF